MNKFEVGDDMIILNMCSDPDIVVTGKVIDVNNDGYGWLPWVKYKIKVGTQNWFMGDYRSPDVLSAEVLTVDEYNLKLAKEEYESIIDHGNGD